MIEIWFKLDDTDGYRDAVVIRIDTVREARLYWDKLSGAGFYMRSRRP